MACRCADGPVGVIFDGMAGCGLISIDPNSRVLKERRKNGYGTVGMDAAGTLERV